MEQQIGSRLRKVHDRCMLLPCLFNLCAEHIVRNAQLDELQAGVRIGGRNINNLRHADGTAIMAESKEETKDSLDKGIERE